MPINKNNIEKRPLRSKVPFSACVLFVILHRILQTRFVARRVKNNKAFLYAEGTNRLLKSQAIRGNISEGASAA